MGLAVGQQNMPLKQGPLSAGNSNNNYLQGSQNGESLVDPKRSAPGRSKMGIKMVLPFGSTRNTPFWVDQEHSILGALQIVVV